MGLKDCKGRNLARGQRVKLEGIVLAVRDETGFVSVQLIPGTPGHAPIMVDTAHEGIEVVADPPQGVGSGGPVPVDEFPGGRGAAG